MSLAFRKMSVPQRENQLFTLVDRPPCSWEGKNRLSFSLSATRINCLAGFSGQVVICLRLQLPKREMAGRAAVS